MQSGLHKQLEVSFHLQQPQQAAITLLHVQDGKVDWGTQGKDAAKTYGEGFKVCQLQSMAAL